MSRHRRRQRRTDRRRRRAFLQETSALEALAAAALFDPPPGSLACKRCGQLRSMDGPPAPCASCGGISFVTGITEGGPL